MEQQHQLKDKYFKEMLQRHLKDFMFLLHPGQEYEIISAPLVKDPALRAELKFYTVAFLQSYYSQKFLTNYFSEEPKMLEHWESVPIFGERIKQRAKEAWEDGLKEGREEGFEEATTFILQENILDTLNLRFGVANGSIARAIHAIDEPKKLRGIFHRIIKAESLEAVKKMLAAQKRPAKKRARSRAK